MIVLRCPLISPPRPRPSAGLAACPPSLDTRSSRSFFSCRPVPCVSGFLALKGPDDPEPQCSPGHLLINEVKGNGTEQDPETPAGLRESCRSVLRQSSAALSDRQRFVGSACLSFRAAAFRTPGVLTSTPITTRCIKVAKKKLSVLNTWRTLTAPRPASCYLSRHGGLGVNGPARETHHHTGMGHVCALHAKADVIVAAAVDLLCAPGNNCHHAQAPRCCWMGVRDHR